MEGEIRSGRCPYCGARYLMTDGCERKCDGWRRHAALVAAAIAADVTEQDEVEGKR